MTRVLSKDALGIRHAIACDIPSVRQAALDHVIDVIANESGSTSRIAERLGVGVSTYSRWVETIPEIRAAHHLYRPANQTGPKPRE